MWCASSISTNCGSGIRAARKRPTTSCNFGRRFLVGQHLDFGCRRQIDTEGNRDQREPWQRSGVRVRHLAAQTLRDVDVGVVAAEAHRLAQQLAPYGVRRGRRVGLAGRVELAESGRRVAQRFEQPRLADAGLADELDQPALSRRARWRMPCGSTPSSALRPVSGSRCCCRFSRARALARGPPTRHVPARPCP